MLQDKKTKIIEYLKINSFTDEVWKEFIYSNKSNANYIVWHISNYGRLAKIIKSPMENNIKTAICLQEIWYQCTE